MTYTSGHDPTTWEGCTDLDDTATLNALSVRRSHQLSFDNDVKQHLQNLNSQSQPVAWRPTQSGDRSCTTSERKPHKYFHTITMMSTSSINTTRVNHYTTATTTAVGTALVVTAAAAAAYYIYRDTCQSSSSTSSSTSSQAQARDESDQDGQTSPLKQRDETLEKYNAEQYIGIEKKECPSITFQEALDLREQRQRRHQQDSDDTVKSNDRAVFVDTRTPKEYNEAHVYNAINIPIMNDYQRHIVGMTYKQVSREAAIKKGKEFFAPCIVDYIQRFEKYKNTDTMIYVYCWRGGMRSRIVVNLLRMNGHSNVVQLKGGYKTYINDIVWKGLDEMSKSYSPTFIVLFGNTGTKKTEILHRLSTMPDKTTTATRSRSNSTKLLPVIDLEGLAAHKGSLFGGVNETPRSQKMFSILVYHQLYELRDHKYIFVEGESYKVGNVFLPEFVYQKIEKDLSVLINASIPTRVDSIRQAYIKNDDSVQQIHEVLDSLTLNQRIGGKNVQMLHEMLDNKDYDGCIEWLLKNYYDARYRYAKKGYKYEVEVSSDDIDLCCQQLSEYYHSLTAEQDQQ